MSDEHGDADYYVDLAGTRYAHVGEGKWRRLQRFHGDRDWFLCPDAEPWLCRIMELEAENAELKAENAELKGILTVAYEPLEGVEHE